MRIHFWKYVSIIVSIFYQVLPCKICSKQNSEDQKSKKHPKHNGFENDRTKPFKYTTELADASPQISIKVDHLTSNLSEDKCNESDLSKLSKFKCDLCTEMFCLESNLKAWYVHECWNWWRKTLYLCDMFMNF